MRNNLDQNRQYFNQSECLILGLGIGVYLVHFEQESIEK